jgi:hypothetical protein
MQAELDAAALPIPVRILGVNGIGHEAGNAENCAGRVLPWLQDVAAVNVWAVWAVTYRDVIVLDADNEVLFIDNLTGHDLQNPAHYEALKAALAAAAGAP